MLLFRQESSSCTCAYRLIIIGTCELFSLFARGNSVLCCFRVCFAIRYSKTSIRGQKKRSSRKRYDSRRYRRNEKPLQLLWPNDWTVEKNPIRMYPPARVLHSLGYWPTPLRGRFPSSPACLKIHAARRHESAQVYGETLISATAADGAESKF